MNKAAVVGKKIDLAIPAGVDISAWLFAPPSNGAAGAGFGPLPSDSRLAILIEWISTLPNHLFNASV